jgi:histidine triad (HIT) family protein
MEPCAFCEIVAGRAPVSKIYEWPDALAFTPLNPVTPGHALIVPKAHVSDYTDDPGTTALVFGRAAQLGRTLLYAGASNLITSAGDEATQTVFHMHVHLIPRGAGDRLSLPWDVR